jgi:hypothetical protein
MQVKKTYAWSDSRSLHLIQQASDLAKVGYNTTVWIQSALTISTGRQSIYVEFHRTTRVHLEGEIARLRVLPQLE